MSRTASIISGLLTLLISIVPAFADQGHLLIGTWTIDVSKLTMPNAPKSVTIALARVGGGQYKMSVDIVDGDGAKRHGVTTFKPDGAPSPELGNADYDVVSMTMPSRRIWVMGGGLKASSQYPSLLAVGRRQARDRNRRDAQPRRHAAHESRFLDAFEIAGRGTSDKPMNPGSLPPGEFIGDRWLRLESACRSRPNPAAERTELPTR